MVAVDRLRVRFPRAVGERADRIAWLVADRLASSPVEASLEIKRLVVPAVRVPANASDEDVADLITAAVQMRIAARGATPAR